MRLQTGRSQLKHDTHVTRVGSHDGQVVFVDDLLHLLHAAEVTQHVADRDNVAVLDELGSDGFAAFNGASADGLTVSFDSRSEERFDPMSAAHLFDKVGSLGEVLDQLQLEVGTLGSTTTVSGRAPNDDGTTASATTALVDLARYGATHSGSALPCFFKSAW